jgi:hypothetical protein
MRIWAARVPHWKVELFVEEQRPFELLRITGRFLTTPCEVSRILLPGTRLSEEFEGRSGKTSPSAFGSKTIPTLGGGLRLEVSRVFRSFLKDPSLAQRYASHARHLVDEMIQLPNDSSAKLMSR